MSHIVINGVTSNRPYARLELNEFVKNEKFFTLLIRALADLQNVDESSDASYFGIAGIHGRPYVAWSGAAGSYEPGPNLFGGYCTHGTVLFPTWHRPYVLLFEQMIQKHALRFAMSYEVESTAWIDAALELRVPYWAWEQNIVPPPEFYCKEMVTIIDFDGSTITVTNPLLRYRFSSKHPHFEYPYNEWPTTLRHPNLSGTEEDIAGLVSQLEAIQEQTSNNTMYLLHSVETWQNFSNHTQDNGGSSTNSLEAIHDSVHNAVGGSEGHMTVPDYAAFDPLFWFHHTNIDRLLSLWSAGRPRQRVNKSVNDVAGTYTIPPNANVNCHTPLAPFWSSQTTFWTSESLLDRGAYYNSDHLGYFYPEFAMVDRDQPKEVEEAVQRYMDDLLENKPDSIFNINADRGDVDQWYNWTVRVRVRKFEYGRSFSVLILLGEVPEKPVHWMTSDNLVGVHHIWASIVDGHCENCRRNIDTVNEGFVHINREILKRKPEQVRFDPEDIKPYLEKNLHWQAIDPTQNPIHLDSLEVTILTETFSKVPGCKYPVPGQRIMHHDVTFGLPGGATIYTAPELQECDRCFSNCSIS